MEFGFAALPLILIDKDEKRFTVELLRKWKGDAVAHALKDVVTSAAGNYQQAAIEVELDDDDDAFLRSLYLSAEKSVDVVARRLREATERDVAAFRSVKDWPAHTISLNLTLHASDGRHSITLEGMAAGIHVGEPLNLVAPPRDGKDHNASGAGGEASSDEPSGFRRLCRLVNGRTVWRKLLQFPCAARRIPCLWSAALHADRPIMAGLCCCGWLE